MSLDEIFYCVLILQWNWHCGIVKTVRTEVLIKLNNEYCPPGIRFPSPVVCTISQKCLIRSQTTDEYALWDAMLNVMKVLIAVYYLHFVE